MAYLRKLKDKDDKSKEGWQININYTDPATGKRRRKTKVVKCKKKKAQSIMANMIKKLETGTLLNPDKTTLEEYLKTWLKNKEKNVAYRIYKEYYNINHSHIIPSLGKILITH